MRATSAVKSGRHLHKWCAPAATRCHRRRDPRAGRRSRTPPRARSPPQLLPPPRPPAARPESLPRIRTPSGRPPSTLPLRWPGDAFAPPSGAAGATASVRKITAVAAVGPSAAGAAAGLLPVPPSAPIVVAVPPGVPCSPPAPVLHRNEDHGKAPGRSRPARIGFLEARTMTSLDLVRSFENRRFAWLRPDLPKRRCF